MKFPHKLPHSPQMASNSFHFWFYIIMLYNFQNHFTNKQKNKLCIFDLTLKIATTLTVAISLVIYICMLSNKYKSVGRSSTHTVAVTLANGFNCSSARNLSGRICHHQHNQLAPHFTTVGQSNKNMNTITNKQKHFVLKLIWQASLCN